MNESFSDLLSVQDKLRFAIICGMAKSGTTLTASLLDNHPQLTVFPEELRFMDAGCHRMENTDSDKKLLENSNIQHLKVDKVEYTDITQSHGTGYGLRDHSNLDFSSFTQIFSDSFAQASTPFERYLAVFYAYNRAKGNTIEALLQQPLLVSKSPHNEVFMHSWMKMFGDKGRYIWMVRDPFELYYSMSNIAQAAKTNKVSVEDFCALVNSRLELMKCQSAPTIFLKYEDLISQPKQEIQQLAQFLEIEQTASLNVPTKNGVAWKGNSSRGKVASNIYANPSVAKEKLMATEVSYIEEHSVEFCELFHYFS